MDDLEAHKLKRKLKDLVYALIYMPNFTCVFFFRLNNWMWRKRIIGWKFFNVVRFYIFKNDISCRATIGKGFRIVHTTDIVIPSEAVIGDNCTILNGVSIGTKGRGHREVPVIGNNVTIGTGAKIFGDIKIEDGTRVKANSVTYK